MQKQKKDSDSMDNPMLWQCVLYDNNFISTVKVDRSESKDRNTLSKKKNTQFTQEHV